MRTMTYLKYTFAFILLVYFGVGCITGSRKLGLSELTPRLSEFEDTDLNPVREKKANIPITNMPKYDGFFEQAHKTIVTLKIGENVAESALQKAKNDQDITREMEAALYLEEELPSLIAGMPILQATGKDIQNNLESDFTGSKASMLPAVGAELASVMTDLAEYSIKAPKIFSEIQRLRSDASNFATGVGEKTTDKTQAEELEETDEKEEEKSIEKEEPKDKDPKPERTIAGLTITPEIRRIRSYSPAPKKTSEKGEPRLTDEQKEEAEYNKKLKQGLLDVFRAESRRNVKKLSRLTLHHPIPRVRAAGALALGRLKLGRWTIEHAIKKDGYVVRTAAYKALSDHGNRRSLKLFVAGIGSEDTDIQAYSLLGIGKTKDPSGRELILSKGLTSSHPKVLGHSLRGLAYYQVPADLDLIQKYLGSENSELSDSAIEALTIHNTPESLLVLENALVDHPKLAREILDAIGESKELAATFFLVRASQLYEDEKILRRIGRILLKRKAFGTYGMVVVKDDRIRSQYNERAKALGIVRLSDVGRINSSTKKRFVARIKDELEEDVYHNMTFENRILGSKNRYVRGWIFGKKIQVIEIKKPNHNDPAVLQNLKTGKYQNLYDPGN